MSDQRSLAIAPSEAKTLFADLQALPVIVLAVSGGPDSTALMLLVARWRDLLKTKPRLIAVTVDHGLRKESKGEAAAVARLARKLNIAHRTVRWNGRKPSTGVQEKARAARYRLLGEAACLKVAPTQTSAGRVPHTSRPTGRAVDGRSL